MRTITWIGLAALALLLSGCPAGGDDDAGDDDTGNDDDGADDDGADDDGADDDAGDDDAGDDDSELPDPVWNCTSGFTVDVSPVPVDTDDLLHMDITQHKGENGAVYIGLSGTAPNGDPVDATLDDITGLGPWTWWYIYAGLHEGRYDWIFTADSGATWLCDITVWVGPAGGDDDVGDDDVGDDDVGDDDIGDDDDSVPPPPSNPIGIGLVSPGNTTQWDRAAELCGRGGHIKLIFPGMTVGMGGPPQDWIDATNAAYARQLVPVIRLGPPWGSMNIRDLSDDNNHMDYTSFAQSYANVVAGLPKLPGWPLVIEVHNEPNLCYEWACDPADGWLNYATAAAEYAAFLRDVNDALNALGDPRIRVINGGYAPGGVESCECGGSGYSGGITSIPYMQAMEAAVPGIHAALDGFASHSYPSQGQGWGFFRPYGDCAVGLHYFEDELAAVGINKPVYITETGWTIDHPDCQQTNNCGDRNEVAQWTLQAYQNDWFSHPQIEAVMPFMLQDGSWDNFAWVDTGNNPYPVFTTVRDWRCAMQFPDPC